VRYNRLAGDFSRAYLIPAAPTGSSRDLTNIQRADDPSTFLVHVHKPPTEVILLISRPRTTQPPPPLAVAVSEAPRLQESRIVAPVSGRRH
jgi:hypothetical protein